MVDCQSNDAHLAAFYQIMLTQREASRQFPSANLYRDVNQNLIKIVHDYSIKSLKDTEIVFASRAGRT